MAIRAHSTRAPIDHRALLPLLAQTGQQSSLDLASAIHVRRALAEAVDHAIALMDALDAHS
jgi:hypothetical protein